MARLFSYSSPVPGDIFAKNGGRVWRLGLSLLLLPERSDELKVTNSNLCLQSTRQTKIDSSLNSAAHKTLLCWLSGLFCARYPLKKEPIPWVN